MNSVLVCLCLIFVPLPEGAYFDNGTYLVAPNYETRNPLWVAEHIVKGPKVADRAGIDFKSDPRIPKKYRVDDSDYKSSGMDKGHMAPAMNHTDSVESLESTFLYSNACPQFPKFNRGIWKKLEEQINKLDDAWVITVPFYEDSESLKIGKMWVPSHYGKALLYKGKETYWIIPHRHEIFNPDLNTYKVSKNEFESRSGLHLWSEINEPRAKASGRPKEGTTEPK